MKWVRALRNPHPEPLEGRRISSNTSERRRRPQTQRGDDARAVKPLHRPPTKSGLDLCPRAAFRVSTPGFPFVILRSGCLWALRGHPLGPSSQLPFRLRPPGFPCLGRRLGSPSAHSLCLACPGLATAGFRGAVHRSSWAWGQAVRQAGRAEEPCSESTVSVFHRNCGFPC